MNPGNERKAKKTIRGKLKREREVGELRHTRPEGEGEGLDKLMQTNLPTSQLCFQLTLIPPMPYKRPVNDILV